MTHEDAGHYALKHPQAAAPDARIAEAVNSKVSNGKISCAAVHKIAADLDISPSEVGRTVDLMEIRLYRCQLGLFGYGPQRRIVEAAESVTLTLKEAIEASLIDNRLPCRVAWEIADNMGLKKMDVSNACEALNVKIGGCQIGSFK